MGRKSTISIDDRLAMKLYAEGLGWREIGRILGIHPFQVSEYFRKKGLKAHNPVGGVREWNTDKAADMLHCGCTVRQVAKELGISESTVYKWLKEKKNKGEEI